MTIIQSVIEILADHCTHGHVLDEEEGFSFGERARQKSAHLSAQDEQTILDKLVLWTYEESSSYIRWASIPGAMYCFAPVLDCYRRRLSGSAVSRQEWYQARSDAYESLRKIRCAEYENGSIRDTVEAMFQVQTVSRDVMTEAACGYHIVLSPVESWRWFCFLMKQNDIDRFVFYLGKRDDSLAEENHLACMRDQLLQML